MIQSFITKILPIICLILCTHYEVVHGQTDEQLTQSSEPQANVLFGESVPQSSISQSTSTRSSSTKINQDIQTSSPLALPILDKKEDLEEKKYAEEANIFLNFNAASLSTVVNYLGDLRKINILPHKDLEAIKVTLATRTGLTQERAWDVLLTLMEMNGFTIINVDGTYRIISSKENTQEPLPMYSSIEYGDKKGVEPENLPDNDMVVRYIYFFKNMKAETAQAILRTMFADEKSIIINRDLNACIIKEQCSNIKSALKVVKELDTGGLRESIQVIQLKHADAQTIADLFKDVLSGGQEEQRTIRFTPLTSQQEKRYFSSSTKIFPDQAKNTLILLGTEANLKKIIEFIYKYLDVPIGDAESRLHIKEIRHAKAEQLRPILEAIIRPPKGQGTEKSAVVGEYKFFEDVIITAETGDAAEEGKRGSGNRLIIACNKDDWDRLERFIEKLDKPQPQVAIEVMVIAVSIDQNKSLGAQMHGFAGKHPGLGINEIDFNNLGPVNNIKIDSTTGIPQYDENGKTISNMMQLTNAESSPSFITLGGATIANQSIWGVIQSIFNLTNAHVIQQPFLVANNYQQCTVDVKETRRIPGVTVSGHGEQPRNQLRDVSASVKVDLTPQINVDGLVDLSMEITVEEFKDDPSAPGNTTDPAKVNRFLKTRASLRTGEILVLGGLTRSDQTESHYRTPIFADIPIIGNFFKNKSKRKQESNLYIFLRPSIIKPSFEGEPDEYTQLKLDYSKLQMMRNDTYSRDNDPIQRWFFKPSKQSIKSKISETKRGIFRPIDDFTYGKDRPPLVRIAEDPFYKVSESIEKERTALAARKLKQRTLQQRLTPNKPITKEDGKIADTSPLQPSNNSHQKGQKKNPLGLYALSKN